MYARAGAAGDLPEQLAAKAGQATMPQLFIAGTRLGTTVVLPWVV